MVESKLKQILEKEGFEELEDIAFIFPEIKGPSARYFQLNTLLEAAISLGYTDIAIDLSKSKENHKYIIQIYGKK